MARSLHGKLAGRGLREDRMQKTANTPSLLDTYIRAIAAADGNLTPEQANRLRDLLPTPTAEAKGTNGLIMGVVGMLIALAVIGLTGYIVLRLEGSAPAVIAPTLTSFAAALAAVPPIIKALRS